VCLSEKDPSSEGCIREIITNNEYELHKYQNLETTIIDIGANCGIATIILAKQNPKSIIYSFEPDPTVFKLLEENIRVNNLTNVKHFNLAMSDNSNKVLTLCFHPQWSGGNTTCADITAFNNFHNTNSSYITVKCISLDDIINEHNISSIGVFKIDCEGAEYEIIYNSEKIKSGIIKNIVGEFHDLQYNTKADNNTSKLLDYCKQYIDGNIKITLLKL